MFLPPVNQTDPLGKFEEKKTGSDLLSTNLKSSRGKRKNILIVRMYLIYTALTSSKIIFTMCTVSASATSCVIINTFALKLHSFTLKTKSQISVMKLPPTSASGFNIQAKEKKKKRNCSWILRCKRH